MMRLVGVVVVLAGIVLFPLRASAELENVPAYWVSSERVAPRTTDFDWHGMVFVAPDHGWFVGGELILEVNRDELRLWFPRREWWEATLWTVAAVDGANVWAGGALLSLAGGDMLDSRAMTVEGLLLRWDGAQWTPARFGDVPWRQVQVDDMALSGPDDGWAIANFEPEPNVRSTFLLRFDGSAWQAQAPAWPLGVQWSMRDVCLTRDGGGWLVGSRGEGGNRRLPHALRRRGGSWEEVPAPLAPFPAVQMNRVACLADGGAVALGSGAFSEEWRRRYPEPLLWAYRDGWEPVALPDELRWAEITDLAAPGLHDIWLAVGAMSLSDRPYFLHYSGGHWQRVEGPVLPTDVRQDYVLTEMQFVSPTEAWAIASGQGGGVLSRGLIFHYKDGVWRVRNWSWHWWNERWLGLEPTWRGWGAAGRPFKNP